MNINDRLPTKIGEGAESPLDTVTNEMTLEQLPDELLLHLLSFLKDNAPYLKPQDEALFKISHRFSAVYKDSCIEKLRAMIKRGVLKSADFKDELNQLSRLFHREQHALPLPHPYLKTLDLSSVTLTSAEEFLQLFQKVEKEADDASDSKKKWIATPQLQNLALLLKVPKKNYTGYEEEEESLLELQPILQFLAEQKQLTALKMSAFFSKDDIAFLCKQLPSLKKLDIDFQGRGHFAERLKDLATLRQLQHLTIRNPDFVDFIDFEEDPAGEEVFRFFNQLKSFSLDLQYGRESQDTLDRLFPLQEHLTHLEHFSVRQDLNFGICDWLSHFPAPTQLSSLSIATNIIFREDLNELKGLTGLEKLELGEDIENALNDGEIDESDEDRLLLIDDIELVKMLHDKINLKELSLELLGITGDGIVQALATLANRSQLTQLEIRSCQRMSYANLISLLENHPLSSIKIEGKDCAKYFERNKLWPDEMQTIYKLDKTFSSQEERTSFIEELKKEEGYLFYSDLKAIWKAVELDELDHDKDHDKLAQNSTDTDEASSNLDELLSFDLPDLV